MKYKLLTVLFASLLLQVSRLSAQVLINELSAANRTNMADDFGEFEDWIELYNAGAATVDISNFFLSDNPANPTSIVLLFRARPKYGARHAYELQTHTNNW
jgi:hypothetical protein